MISLSLKWFRVLRTDGCADFLKLYLLEGQAAYKLRLIARKSQQKWIKVKIVLTASLLIILFALRMPVEREWERREEQNCMYCAALVADRERELKCLGTNRNGTHTTRMFILIYCCFKCSVWESFNAIVCQL